MRFIALVSIALIGIAGCSQTAVVPLDTAASTPVPDGTRILAQTLDAPLPIDRDVTIGKLPNGLTYVIRPNGEPANRIELRLAVNAGSVLEDDDQRGLAHFIEHMAFNGTEHFARHELVGFLESIGMRFGPELNAYTAFDETVYMLQVPADSAVVVATAFRILVDWASGVVFEPGEIERERGVVIEEWRQGRGADARIRDRQLPVLFAGSTYADRLPIGDPAVIRNADRDTIMRFYHDWYRPDMMAVIVVGDITPDAARTLIETSFGRIADPPSPRTRPEPSVPDVAGTRVSIVGDPEASRATASIYVTHELRPETTVGDYRRTMVELLANRMLNRRMDALIDTAEPPFLAAYTARGTMSRSRGVDVLTVRTGDDAILDGIVAAMTEAVRAARHGFTPPELEREKRDLLRGMEQAYDERGATPSGTYAAEYTRHILEDEPIPGIDNEYAYYRDLLPGITIDEVNAHARVWARTDNRIVLVSGPETSDTSLPDSTAVLDTIDAVERLILDPYIDELAETPLVSVPPDPSPVSAEHVIGELGVTEWTLANGVRVILKPTDFKKDELLLTAYSPGGLSLVPDSLYIPAFTAVSVLGEGGAGAFTRSDLGKKLAGRAVQVTPWIDDYEEGVDASGSPRDAETLFELLYLTLTAPRRDTAAFSSYTARLRDYASQRATRPETAFDDTLLVTMADYHPRSHPLTPALADSLNLDASLAVFRDRFADASDFTFVIIGAFTPDGIRPLVERWLGGLPARGGRETWHDTGLRAPRGIIEKSVRRGIEQKSRVRLVFTGPFDWSRINRYQADAMTSVLRLMLRDTLREDMGGTYGAGVSLSLDRVPSASYRLSIDFGCAPDRVEELTRAVFACIDSLRTEGPTADRLAKVKQQQRRERETDIRDNTFWLSALKFYISNGEDPIDILHYDTLVDGLTADAVRHSATTVLDPANHVRLVLYPETDTPQKE